MTTLSRTVLALIASMLSISALAASNAAMNHVNRAVEAQGGEAALSQVRTVTMQGFGSAQEFESSYEPGKAAKPKAAVEFKLVVQRDLTNGNSRIDWDRRVVRTPKPLLFKYSEIVSDGKHQVSNVPRILRDAITPLWD